MIAGIWDCLSSQDVVNFVRYQVSEGKELTVIGEMICDFCLAPDTSSGSVDIGCDNMTIVIVAITHGRSKKEWYTWIKKRVRNKYGYETPKAIPQIYSQSRLTAFRTKKEFRDKELREKERRAKEDAKSAPSSNQAPSQKDSSAGSAGKDKLLQPKLSAVSNAFSSVIRRAASFHYSDCD